MTKISDDELIAVIRERFDVNRRVINELRELTGRLEETNNRLQESEALKGHFLSNIRNEINNPLTAIMGFAYQLMDGSSNPQQAAFNGHMIYDEAYELHCQLENVFAAAGLEAGQEAPDPAEIDIAELLAEVLASLEHRRSEKGIEVQNNCSAPMPFVADPRFLQIILRNLLANAMEFSPQGGIVTINQSGDDTLLRLAIGDAGPGIDPANHETVFDRFRQLDRGPCKSHRGLGLGLSICRALAELSGGMISIESSLGAGSEFILVLPRQEDEAAFSGQEEEMGFFETEESF
jgi:signal transduction histidine kinase